jgi:hypothetical protein
MHEYEAAKWGWEQDSYDDQIAQLDEQKQQNMLLKEKIDGMWFEMDDMRSGVPRLY